MSPPPHPRLRDPRRAAAHLASTVNPQHFAEHTAVVVLCDVRSEPLIHVKVMGCAPDPSATDCCTVLERLLAEAPSVAGVAVAVTRPGNEQIQACDRAWFRALHRVCHARGLAAYGVFVVGAHGVRPVHVDDAA